MIPNFVHRNKARHILNNDLNEHQHAVRLVTIDI